MIRAIYVYDGNLTIQILYFILESLKEEPSPSSLRTVVRGLDDNSIFQLIWVKIGIHLDFRHHNLLIATNDKLLLTNDEDSSALRQKVRVFLYIHDSFLSTLNIFRRTVFWPYNMWAPSAEQSSQRVTLANKKHFLQNALEI